VSTSEAFFTVRLEMTAEASLTPPGGAAYPCSSKPPKRRLSARAARMADAPAT
jgi:hypothetical protein